jgi:Cu-Zn family superoxide dismutase
MRSRLALVLASTALVAGTALPAHAAERGYDLPEAGVYLEGIGVDQRAGAIYVSATNRDGTIYRGEIGSGTLSVWVGPRAGDNGRGIAVDDAGRVYVAGGPSGEVRVFDRHGALLAELATGATGAFLNDVWIGPDGAAYVTDSSLPVLWRVSTAAKGWRIERWLDVSADITYTVPLTDFDLGGIVSTPDRRYLLVVQGSTGQLWRIDLHTKEIREVSVDSGPLATADGLVLRGRTLVVIQNFARRVTTLQLDRHALSARTVAVTATPANRTLTTADFARGTLLAVDAQFGFPAPPAEDRVIAVPFR